MRTRTTTVTLLLLAAALTACTSSDPAPAPDKPAATTAAPTIDKAQLVQQCVDAIAEVISARPADFDPETDSDPQPTECDAVPEDEYLDAYYDGLAQANEAALNAR